MPRTKQKGKKPSRNFDRRGTIYLDSDNGGKNRNKSKGKDSHKQPDRGDRKTAPASRVAAPPAMPPCSILAKPSGRRIPPPPGWEAFEAQRQRVGASA